MSGNGDVGRINVLKKAILLGALLLGSGALAADGAETALERWQADPSTIFDASEVDLADFKWVARPVVVFAESPADPAFREQVELLTERLDELVERDVVLITDTSPDEKSDIRRKLRPRGFMLTLIGKDGGVKLRKPFPWDVRELTRQIDKMPIRRQELRDRRLDR
ncbi:MAG: DUF4174 domain-containing protein [Silicimonas sp.]|nr:DUF4174 domain-containing protein [Silicimonas sp.]NND18207.1 DUF4174 domain-containing protein [Silicimonas sp.]